MKHKASELEGALLDAAVAKALGWLVERLPEDFMCLSVLDTERQKGSVLDDEDEGVWSPSRLWEHGGPIIERERINLMFIGERGWSANFEQHFDEGSQDDPHTGPTPLIAAMRAYVASKFGEEVELP
jgi:hypothetical protein